MAKREDAFYWIPNGSATDIDLLPLRGWFVKYIIVASGAVTARALAHEIDVGVLLVGRPVALEIVEKGWPIQRQPVMLEIRQQNREAVVAAPAHGDRRGGRGLHGIRDSRAACRPCSEQQHSSTV